MSKTPLQLENKKIPKLRFPGFYGEWKECKFGELFTFRTTNSFSRENLNYKSGKVKNIHYGDIHTKFKTLFDISKEVVPFVSDNISLNKMSLDSYCKKGDLIIADASEDYADIGKSIEIININKEKVLAGLHTLQARPSVDSFSSGFIGPLMKTNNVHSQIKTIAQGTKVLGISANRLANISINFPALKEQTKIADFVQLIDKWFENLKVQKESLEAYKKGMMRK
ncbi:MAG: restriction endonuclease subunit S, partial [bacterium]